MCCRMRRDSGAGHRPDEGVREVPGEGPEDCHADDDDEDEPIVRPRSVTGYWSP